MNTSIPPDLSLYSPDYFNPDLWSQIDEGTVTYQYAKLNFPYLSQFNTFLSNNLFQQGLSFGNIDTSSLNYDGTITLKSNRITATLSAKELKDLLNTNSILVMNVNGSVDVSCNSLFINNKGIRKKLAAELYVDTSMNALNTNLRAYTDTTVNNAITKLINNSPTALDTLNELATALGNDPNFAATITNLIGTKTTLTQVQTNNNNFSGTNAFNFSLPTSSLTPTDGNQSVTKTYTDGKFQPITGMTNYLKTTDASTTYLKIADASLNYQTKSGMSSYLTTASASSTYQPLSQMNNYLKVSDASLSYQTIAGMSNYLTNANASATYQPMAQMSNYLTVANASATYQTSLGMSNYLTVLDASATYQPLNQMSNYLKVIDASGTYQRIALMSNYLTVANASATYQPLLTYDAAPTLNSTKMVTSGNIYNALQNYLTVANSTGLTGISYSANKTIIDNDLVVNKNTSLLNLNVSNASTTKYLNVLDSMSFRDIGYPTDSNKFYQNYLAYDNVAFNNRSKNGRLTFYASDINGNYLLLAEWGSMTPRPHLAKEIKFFRIRSLPSCLLLLRYRW